MAWLGRKKVYDRARLLDQAARARKRGKREKAIGFYRQVLDKEPQNPDLHRRIAPLLAETGRHAEAWKSYQSAVEGLVLKGFVEQAVGTLREATTRMPRQPDAWNALADLELSRKRPEDAHRVLFEAHRHFRFKRGREHAISLLLRARKLAPRDFRTSYVLAGELARSGAHARAQTLLDSVAHWARGSQLRRVRGRQFGLSPTPAAAWRWMQALLGSS